MRLFICALWSHAEKVLTSWLLFVVSYFLEYSWNHECFGSLAKLTEASKLTEDPILWVMRPKVFMIPFHVNFASHPKYS